MASCAGCPDLKAQEDSMKDRRSRSAVAKSMAVAGVMAAVLLVTSMCAAQAQGGGSAASDARLQKAYRFPQGGWIYVHLEGSPADIGYQHGYLLAPEIADGFKTVKLRDTHRTNATGISFARRRENILWPQHRRRISAGVAGHRRRPESPRRRPWTCGTSSR